MAAAAAVEGELHSSGQSSIRLSKEGTERMEPREWKKNASVAFLFQIFVSLVSEANSKRTRARRFRAAPEFGIVCPGRWCVCVGKVAAVCRRGH